MRRRTLSFLLVVLIVCTSPLPESANPLKLSSAAPPTGWRSFRPPHNFLTAPFVIEPTLTQRLPCTDQWVSFGQPCEVKDSGKLDILWTWINAAAVDTKGSPAGRRLPIAVGSSYRRFRTHGEMRNSMRSVLDSLPSGLTRQYILLTADISADDTEELRLGSVPTWLDINQGAGLRVIHHSDVFRIPASSLPSGSDVEEQGREWRDRVVPSFNSLAIESQLANIQDFAPTLLYLNDDFFLLKSLSSADFETSLYGPVFRIQFDLSVGSTAPSRSRQGVDKEGEWPSLEYTNWLLDRRFGERQRRYLHHVAKAAAIWAEEIAKTAEVRFRGHGPQVYLVYLTTWYTIEKHREALLHSFIMLRADADADGVFSSEEWRNLIDGLDGGDILVQPREGGSPYSVQLNFARAGLAGPKETEYEWHSSDGYPLIRTVRRDMLTYCSINVDRCFQGGSALDVFRRVAFEMPECGDCLIQHLINRSGPEGLAAFLPPATAPSAPPPGPLLAKSWEDEEFLSGLGREFAVDSIQRYTYVVGTSPLEFLALQRPSDTKKLPKMNSPVAFLAVNDDLQNSMSILSKTDADMRAWYAVRWGAIRGWWEKD
ncbi:hypothetical protein B0H11DRAFT_2007749 [Mycena galericulata]|nr:hypothetical protein B0H11DRAFT_2007749 [Mycena galericulata]